MARIAATYWGGGWQWAPAAEDGFTGVWGPDPDRRLTGAPDFWVAIGGRLVPGLSRATWQGGRPDFFAPLSPSSASLAFQTPPSAEPGELVVIASSRRAHWVGRVDDVNDDEVVNRSAVGTVTASDRIGQLAQAKLAGAVITGATLVEQVAAVTALAGVPMTVEVAPSAGTLPTITPPASFTGSVLDYLTMLEQTSNAILVLKPDGTFRALVRAALPDAGVTTYPLAGLDSPSDWRTAKSAGNVFNAFRLVQPSDMGSDVILDVQDDASVALYGLRPWEVTEYRAETAAHYPSGLRTTVAVPRKVLRSAVLKVSDLSQAAIALDGLDWVDRDGDLWQIMSIAHEVVPKRADNPTWRVTIGADQTQSAIAGEADPEPEEPDPPEEPEEPELTTITEVYTTLQKDAVAARTPGGDYYGSGKGDTLPVGRWDGWIFRAFLRWDIDWSSDFPDFHSVKKATIRIRTADQTEVAFGSSPKVYVQYVKENWNEGSEGADGNYHFDNATVYPGPSRGSGGQVLKTVTKAENTTISIVITDIAKRWKDEGNYGIALVSPNESSQAYTTEFQSREGGFDAELTLTCYVEA